MEELRGRRRNCGTSAVFRALNRLGLPSKKSERAAEQDRPGAEGRAGRPGRTEFADIDPARLVWVDETGTNTAMARR
ncbi:MAG: hypothetical protein U0835_20735 [Isosphaeraceae bacterium]